MSALVNRSLRNAVARFRLGPFAFAIYEGLMRANPAVLISNLKFRSGRASDGLPIPSTHLRFLVAGSADIQWFLEGGALGAQAVRDVAAQRSIPLSEGQALLDFGCGCGRVARYWRDSKVRVCGTDYNQRLIDWSRRNLPFGEFAVNQLRPPLSYGRNEFDLIYAFSVFTHLTEDLQRGWMDELTRVLKPGGHLLISTHGQSYAHRLNDAERRRFAAGQLVVRDDLSAAGSNTCSAYHPTAYVKERLAGPLEIVSFLPEGAKGNPHQDLYVLRKP